MSEQPQQPAVTGTGQTRGHTSASPRYCASASPRRELAPGHATPSITRLCADHGVARQTAAHALHVLQDAGLVYQVPGLGYHVCNDILSQLRDPGGQLPDREPGSDEALPGGTALCPPLSPRGGCRPECITS